MIKISFTKRFLRSFGKLDNAMQDVVKEKLNLFKSRSNHSTLKVHKLHGRFAEYHSFSVTSKFRVIFQMVSDSETIMLEIGSHDIYR